MKWLKRLETTNFQSHEKTILHLHRGLNCIVGVSQNGKTAMLRSVRLLRENRPHRFKYHSEFAKSGVTKVKAVTSEGPEATITKTKKNTKYTLKKGGSIRYWRKLNKDVPDKITEALNLTDLNFQGQFDNPFLISNSAGEIARVIHEKTNIDKADEWIKQLNKKIGALKIYHQDGTAELEEKTEQLKAYAGLEALDSTISKVERLDKKIRKLENTYIAIDELFADIIDAEQKIIEQKQYLKAEKQINEIDGINGKIYTLQTERELIEKVLDNEVSLHEHKKMQVKNNKQYISILKRTKKCPTCFGPIQEADIKRIRNEISVVI